MENTENIKIYTILVVDDELDLLEMYEKRFTRAGFNVVLAKNGEEAVEKLDHSSFDAVICDINMPLKNGFDVFNHVRLILKSKLPFIFVTGHGEGTPEMSEALSIGADGVYSKPLSSKILIEHLQKMCTLNSSNK